ncbi:MAG: hypothetical protein IKF82_08415 [Bacilli bacterium]|nr:hypothetical protein [Bacilli bacterium]
MKKFLFFICILLLTGCDITYNLDIDDDFVENISMIEDNSANFSYVIGGTDLISFKNYYVSDFIPIHYNDIYYPESHVKVDGVTYYNKEDLSGYNKIMVNLNGAFDSIDSLSNSNAIWKGCSNINISRDDDIVISASGFKVFDDYKIVDTLSVNIKTKYNVTEHNADKVSDDTYTWLITRDNYLNKRIQITMNEKNDTFFDDPMVKFGLILFIIVSIIGFIILLFKRRFSRINRL